MSFPVIKSISMCLVYLERGCSNHVTTPKSLIISCLLFNYLSPSTLESDVRATHVGSTQILSWQLWCGVIGSNFEMTHITQEYHHHYFDSNFTRRPSSILQFSFNQILLNFIKFLAL